MKKRRRKLSQNERTFITSFMVTICSIGLVWGLVHADAQGRRMSFGDKTPPVSVMNKNDHETQRTYLRIHTMGIEKDLEITAVYKILEEVKAFFRITPQ